MAVRNARSKATTRQRKERESKELAYKAKSGRVKVFPPPPATGRERYHAARFLEDCCDETDRVLRKTWKAGKQLIANRVPLDALPAVVILAAYAKAYGADLVDNYDRLLERYRDNMEDCSHNDKFFASCVLLLNDRGQEPSEEAWESIGIPAIYEELLG